MTQIAWCGLGMQQAALEQPIHPGELNLFYFVPADQRPVASLHGAIDTSIWKPTNVIAAMIYGSHSCKGFWSDVVLRDAQSLLQHGTPMHEPRLTPREALKDVTRLIAFIKGNSRVDL